MKPKTPAPLFWLFAALIVILTLAYSFLQTNISEIKNDGLNNYYMAYNLSSRGLFSEDRAGLRPTMMREPVPVFALAGWLNLTFPNIADADPALTNNKPAIVWVKASNLVWAAILLFSTLIAATAMTDRRWFGLAAMAFVAATFFYAPWQTNILNTDLAASAILMGCLAFAVILIKDRTWWAALGLGVCLGILALTKAIALYASLVFVPCLGLLMFLERENFLRASLLMGLTLISMFVIITPWVVRNYVVFDKPAIALRGGRVLYYRALLNEMPPETYKAAFYYWTDKAAQPFIGSVTGYSRKDADNGGNGPAAPLNRGSSSFRLSDKAAEKAGAPEKAVALLSKMRARHDHLSRQFKAKGAPSPTAEAQAILQKEAIDMIKAKPMHHIAAVAPIYWSMMWLRTVPVWVAPFVCASLFVALAVGALTRNARLLAFTLLPAGIMFLYLLTSHGLPRYSEPIVPVMVVTLLSLFFFAFRRQGAVASHRA
ncbi:hypothetical protein QBK99_16910 [Corticibacterium sp. UT-5YL-CI-8]|nr:hypothetical protein [Tianweitania sp. UT-5YL-CI-8]